MKLNLFFYTHTYEYIKQVMRTQTWCDRARPCAGTSRGSILPLHFLYSLNFLVYVLFVHLRKMNYLKRTRTACRKLTDKN